VNKYFGVGVGRAKNVTELNEFVTELDVVVYLAVEDDPDRSILIPHRLMTTGNINDRQAPVAEMYAKLFINPEAFSVGPAMSKLLRHSLKQSIVNDPDEAD
jgi:hypothetical protein